MEPKRIHLIGIGGIGMSSLARWYVSQNILVSGSDGAKSEITEDLERDGIRVHIGHNSDLKEVDRVICSQAIPETDPELVLAKKFNISILTYPQAIGELTRKYKTLAVAGAHGKSTTTSLLGLVLVKAKLDPTIIVGTKLTELNGSNFRLGKSKWLVLEADEYRGAFWNYSPTLAIINNIDREHLDFYRDLNDVKKSFLKFINNIQEGGTLILNADDANLLSLKKRILNISKKKNLKTIWIGQKNKAVHNIKKVLFLPGKHNLSNALGVFQAAKELGIDEKNIFSVFKSFEGAWRRMEYKGKYLGALVYDDYAHHPNEIKASLAGFKDKYPKMKLLCIFQPHQTARLQKLFKEFRSAFDRADETLILPIYKVAGREENTENDLAKKLVQAIQKEQPKKPLFYLNDPENISKALKTLGTKQKVIVFMGAGNINNYSNRLLSLSD